MTEGTAAAAHSSGAVSREHERTPGESNDGVPTLWIPPATLSHTLDEVAGADCARPFLLLDLFCLDDALGGHRSERAPTLVYELMRPAPFAELRLKVRVEGEAPALASATAVFPNARGYERAVTAHAGVRFLDDDAATGAPRGQRVEPQNDDADELDVERSLAQALAMEALLGVAAPPRADAIRVLRSELLRVASHLSWYAAFVDAVGASASAPFTGHDVRRALEVLHALGGSDAEGVVVGGVREDLPAGWRATIEGFLEELTPRAQAYAELASASPRLLDASKGVAPIDARAATSWAVTGPVLRAAGLACDLREARPYCGYERYEFQVPTGAHGDVYDRARVRLDELRQSLRIIAQCAATMPDGPVRVAVPRATPPGEAFAAVEGSRGVCGCYVASDGASLFVRHRAPGFAHRQALAAMSGGYDEGDLAAIESSVDLGASAV